MTSDDFARHIIDMTQTLYRVACSQLSAPADREDAVQGNAAQGLGKTRQAARRALS